MFEVNLSAQDGWTILMPVGDLDMASAPDLRRHLISAVSSSGARVVVDLAGVHFVDSQGLGTLVGGLKRARSHGGDLRLARPVDAVAELLAMTSLDRAFVVADEIAGAVAPPVPVVRIDD